MFRKLVTMGLMSWGAIAVAAVDPTIGATTATTDAKENCEFKIVYIQVNGVNGFLCVDDENSSMAVIDYLNTQATGVKNVSVCLDTDPASCQGYTSTPTNDATMGTTGTPGATMSSVPADTMQNNAASMMNPATAQ